MLHKSDKFLKKTFSTKGVVRPKFRLWIHTSSQGSRSILYFAHPAYMAFCNFVVSACVPHNRFHLPTSNIPRSRMAPEQCYPHSFPSLHPYMPPGRESRFGYTVRDQNGNGPDCRFCPNKHIPF